MTRWLSYERLSSVCIPPVRGVNHYDEVGQLREAQQRVHPTVLPRAGRELPQLTQPHTVRAARSLRAVGATGATVATGGIVAAARRPLGCRAHRVHQRRGMRGRNL